MTETAFQLVGGSLDGLYLPVAPDAPSVPRQLIVYCHPNKTWTNYVNRKRRVGATDVYKIKSGAKLPAEPPFGYKIVNLHYAGSMTPEQAKMIEDMARAHGGE